jgi:hypothetical protein
MGNMKATKVINHFDLEPELVSMTGSFRYRYFDHLEQIEQDSRFIQDENLPDVPRYNQISWKGTKPIVFINMTGFEESLIHRQSLYFSSDLQEGFCAYTTNPNEITQEMKQKVSDNSSQSSRLDYLLTQIASSAETENIESDISKIKSQMPVLDNTTNRPIIQTDVLESEQPSDIILSNEDMGSILEFSKRSPFSSDQITNEVGLAKSISRKETSKIKENGGTNRFLTYLSYLINHPDLELPVIPRLNPDFLTAFELIGYSITKYLVDSDGGLEYQYTRFVRERTYKDVYVAYGKIYRYELRPVFARYAEPDNIDNEKVVFVSSDESNFIDIKTTEEKAPSPPRNVRFEYILGERIRITWERPASYVSDMSDHFGNNQSPMSKLYDTDDIKGYQLFMRNSLKEPYRLQQYFAFNNTYPAEARIRPAEIIPEDLIISSEYSTSANQNPYPKFAEPKEFIVSIRPNVDYFFTMCSIDAHGNTSQYSSQYKIRRNNVTGEVSIEMISQEGAPKQYPNLLVPSKLIRPSLTVSGYRYMDIHYAPDTQVSKPSADTPAINIQLFELETQVEKNVSITLASKETNNLSN